MIRKLRKGFTIVELVIVIAVIAVLTAVLVPTFVHLSKKAKIASDQSLVANLNTALKMEQGESGKTPKTMHDAVEGLENQGYKLPQFVTKSNQELVYSIDENKFYLSDDKSLEGKNKFNYWHIQSELSQNQEWSVYAYDWKGSTSIEDLTVGFDVGNEYLTSINYNRATAENGRTVVIRTNGGTLTINAEHDKVYHYGVANVVDVQKVDTASYYENGKATIINIAQGRVVVGEGADVQVGGIHVEANNVIVAVENQKELPAVTFETSVETFKVQTTNSEGTKQTESTVTISDNTVVASDGTGAVPAAIQEKIETNNAAEKQMDFDTARDNASDVVEPVLDSSAVARIGTTGYSSLTEAVAAAATGKTVVMIADDRVSLTGATAVKVISIDKNLTIRGAVDANGAPKYTVYGTSNFATAKNAIVISGTCNVTIQNIAFAEFGNEAATGSNGGGAVIRSESANGNLTVQNVTINKINRCAILIQGGQFLIDGCNIDCDKSYGTAHLTKGVEVQNSAHGTIQNTTITGVKDTTAGWTSSGIETYNSSNTLIKNCNIVSMATGIGPSNSSVVRIEDCNISSHAKGIYTYNTANVTVVDTTISVTRPGTDWAMGIYVTGNNSITVENCSISVTGSDYKSIGIYTGTSLTTPVTVTNAEITAYSVFYIGSSTGGGVSVTDGTYRGAIYKYGSATVCTINSGTYNNFAVGLGSGAAKPVIKGGTFSANPSSYINAAQYFVRVVNNKYVVLPVSEATDADFLAYVNDVGYTNMSVAIQNAAGKVLKLNKDLRGWLAFSSGNSYTLDLNGHSITNYTGSSNADTVNVYNSTTLVITDTSSGEKGTITSVEGSAIWTGSSETDESNITIDGGINLVGSSYSIQSSAGATTVTINNATITGDFDINEGSTLVDNR